MAGNVVGSVDGVVPIYDPEGLWRIWDINVVWQGEYGSNRFVPRQNDYVIDPMTFETWIVDHLDPVTLVPTLRSIKPAGMNYSLSEDDVLFGVGPGSDAETYRAYLNDSVYPHTLAVDQRLKIHGTMSSYAKIFLGSDTSEARGEVISKVYDASGNFISTSVPLELVALDSHVNYAVKSVKRCHITRKIPNNERITVVIYADDGHVVSKRQLLIENTDTITDVNTGTKYITEISLESIWLSPTVADQLDYPLNIPMDALNMVGVVHYSDGTKLKLPVDGGKFAMLGLQGRLSSIIGQPHELVLRYLMSPGEIAYASTGVNGKYITKPFRIVTTNPNNSIAVKLFGYPFWEGEAFGYRMRWWLLNLTRNIRFEVTNHVKFAENTGPYDPKLYGYLQRKAVSINLRDVSGSFIPFIHTQVVDIVLNEPPTNALQAAWTVTTESNENYPRFGVQVYGLKTNNLVNFKAGHETFNDWLKAYYRDTLPMVNALQENEAPSPTHFIVTYGSDQTEWSISQWDQDLNISANVNVGTTALIRFIRRTASGDLQLSYAAAMIKGV